ncbi:MAG: integrase [Rhodospirillaceae bacterium]|nr:MAG: integrase [Rhodospirillaceae bacterium]
MATILKRGPYQWQAKVRRKGYPVQTKTFDSKREAEAWGSITESEMARSVFVDRSLSEKMTLADVIKGYMTNEAPTHKGYDSEISRLNKFLRDEAKLAARGMATLKTSDFETYRDQRSKEVAPGTIKRELNLLHSIIEGVRKKLGLLENPISDVKRPRVRDQRDIRLQDGEEKALLCALDDCRNPWVKPAVILAIETAMRRGELLDLRWDNIDLNTRVAKLIDTKNGENRDVPLSSRAIEVLKSLPKSTNGFVFQTSSEGLKNAYERARKRANLQHLNFHDLRHEAVSRLFEAGWNIMEVAAVSGHKDLQSLKRYTNLRAADLAKKMG